MTTANTSLSNHKAFKWLGVVRIVAVASMPLLAVYSDTALAQKFVVGTLGLLIATLASTSVLIGSKRTGPGTGSLASPLSARSMCPQPEMSQQR